MEQHKRLTILVKSDQYFDYVERLAQAASQRERSVKIHMMGEGVALLWEHSLNGLLDVAQVSACSKSVAQFRSRKIEHVPKSVAIVSPEVISEIIQWGDRSVVL